APIGRERMVCRAVEKVHAEIQASPLPSLPLIWTEFNASFANHPQVTDAPYMGPWLAETVRQCDGLAQDMSYWTFSDVFEEGGVVKTPLDRKSTRLNSSHLVISYAVFCLKKKKIPALLQSPPSWSRMSITHIPLRHEIGLPPSQ